MFSYPDISWVVLNAACMLSFISMIDCSAHSFGEQVRFSWHAWRSIIFFCAHYVWYYRFLDGSSKLVTFLDMSYFVHLLVFLNDIFCHLVRLTVVDTSVLEVKRCSPHPHPHPPREGDLSHQGSGRMKPDWFHWLCCKLISGKCFTP